MGTEAKKMQNLERINALIIYGLEKGLWDLLGTSASATTNAIGENILAFMEKDGVNIDDKDPQAILTEIGRFFVEEVGIATRFDSLKTDDVVDFTVENCVLINVEKDLINAGVKPFICPYLNTAAAALRQRMGLKAKVSRFDIDTEKCQCHLQFELI